MAATYKYGIDLGTTNSSIAIIKNTGSYKKEVKVFSVDTYDIPYEIVRSVVGYKDDKVYVGDEGLELLNGNEDNPIRQIKMRLLEQKKDGLVLSLNNRKIYISDVMAEILKRLRERAIAEEPGIQSDGVVIGVPYETPEDVKAVYINALCKAGFYLNEVEAAEKTEFIEEPVAVALHYGRSIAHQNKTALIFDFGGGTLDMAIVELKQQSSGSPTKKQRHKVIAKEGLYRAGEALTKLLFLKVFVPRYAEEYFNNERWEVVKLFRKMGCESNNLEYIWSELQNSGIGWRFINKMDQAKIALSAQEDYVFHFKEPATDGRSEILFKNIILKRTDFEAAIEEVLNDIESTINRLFNTNRCKERGINKKSIDEVLLAGGSSVIPCVRRLLENIFGTEKVYFDDVSKADIYINILTCLSQGLAYAGYNESDYNRIDDITSFDYGILDCFTKKVEVIIPKNTNIEETDYHDFNKNGLPPVTVFSRQIVQENMSSPSFYIEIFEGNDRIMKLSFNKKQHSGTYDLFFKIDAKRGILEVHVYDIRKQKWVDDLSYSERSYQMTKH